MAILKLKINNPWTVGKITVFDDGTESLDRSRLKHVPSIKDKFHIVRDFDDLQLIASIFYNDSKWWWVIYDINNLDDMFILEVGKSLIIPDLDKIKALAL